mmetsp:Transcript_30538/g.66050  ORF Transcript_30538/g.66050 Transcript_30538/m.66050 type:complete len:203 (+) Transcript_30538:76-684(+)
MWWILAVHSHGRAHHLVLVLHHHRHHRVGGAPTAHCTECHPNGPHGDGTTTGCVPRGGGFTGQHVQPSALPHHHPLFIRCTDCPQRRRSREDGSARSCGHCVVVVCLVSLALPHVAHQQRLCGCEDGVGGGYDERRRQSIARHGVHHNQMSCLAENLGGRCRGDMSRTAPPSAQLTHSPDDGRDSDEVGWLFTGELEEGERT